MLERYPDPNKWDKTAAINKGDVFRFAQQWLTEGVPYAFRTEPLTFERARDEIAHSLGESPKHISITGSSRLGHSLGSSFGARYHESSDIDLFVVSAPLFARLAEDGREFARRVLSGDAKARSSQELGWWRSTASTIDQQINEKHYLDHGRLPRAARYPAISQIYKAVERFESSLSLNSHAVRKWRTSVRVYRDWDAALRKIGGSLLLALEQQGFKVVDHERRPRSPDNGATMSQLAEQLRGFRAK